MRRFFLLALFSIIILGLLAAISIPIILEDNATHWLRKTVRQDINNNTATILYGDINVDWRGRFIINNIIITAMDTKAPYTIKIDSIIFTFSLWQWLSNRQYSIKRITIQNPAILQETNSLQHLESKGKKKLYKRNEKKRYTIRKIDITSGTIGIYDRTTSGIENLMQTQPYTNSTIVRQQNIEELYNLIIESIINASKNTKPLQ